MRRGSAGSGPGTRRLAGKLVMAGGVVLAVTVAFALVLIDLRVTALAPAAEREALLAEGIRASLAWAAGSGGAVCLLGLALWLSGRGR